MASDKNILVQALLVNNEPSYSGSLTLNPANDAIILADTPSVTLKYASDGGRDYSQAAYGTQARIGPSGRSADMEAKVQFRGAGSAYTTANLADNLHALLISCGLSASVASGSSVTYAPNSNSPTSSALLLYSRKEVRTVKGAYFDYSFEAKDGGPVVFDFKGSGIVSPVSGTVTAPSITYQQNNVIPPKAENIALSIGGVTSLVVRSVKFEQARAVTPRLNLNAGAGHGGFAPGPRKPKLTIEIESPLISTYDAYTAWQSATQASVSFTIGSTAFNKFTFTAPQAQLSNVTDNADGSVALLTLEFDCPMTTPGADDDYSLLMN